MVVARCRVFLKFFFEADFPGNPDGEERCVGWKGSCVGRLDCYKFYVPGWRESRGWSVWYVVGGSCCNVNIVVCWWL